MDCSRTHARHYKRRTQVALFSAALSVGGFSPLAAQTPPSKPAAEKKQTLPKSGVAKIKPQTGGTVTRVIPMPKGESKAAGNPVVTPTNPAPAPAPPPLSSAAPGTTFTFDYRGSDIMNVLRFYAQMSGLNVTVDPGLNGQVTIINPKPVSLDDAFKILQSVLVVRGFTAIRDGSVLSVVPLDRGVRSTPLVSNGLDEQGNPSTNPQNQVMTQVIPLENVDAEALAKELDPLKSTGASLIGSPGTNALIITDTASNVQRFIKMVDALDKTSNNTELKVYPLKRAEASAITDIINNLYKQITTRGRGAGQQPGQPPPQPGQPQATSGRPAVVAVADVRTNSVIVVASPDNQEQVARTIIARLDDDDSNTLDTKIRKIKYADAQQVANLVNTVLTNQRAAGAGGGQNASFGQRQFGGFNPFGGGQDQAQSVSSSDPFGKVAADPRTNTLLISATAERMRKIDELIDQLDVEVPVESTTFVIPLVNAQAQDVAAALQQAFSTNNQNGYTVNYNFGGGNNGGNNNRRQRVNRRFGSDSSNNNNNRSAPPGPPNAPGDVLPGQGGYNGPDGGSAIPQGVSGVMTADGFVPSDTGKTPQASERTRQYYDYYGGYGGRRRSLGQSGGPQYGRGSSGAYSNLLQLQNNVFVTPSPGGDSIIVTTTPDNIKTLQELIKQLDVVQRQVLIEVIVAEVTLDQNQKLGSSLSGIFKNVFNKTNTGQARLNLTPGTGNVFDVNAAGGQFTVSGIDYSALVQAITTDNKVKVLSTPSVFTSNNQEATIQIVTSIPYIGGQDQGSFNTFVSNNIKFLEIGFNLNVLPVITRQGLVTIDVAQEASDLLRFETLGTGNAALRVPSTNVRFANTLVTVQDGETVAIGGLIRDSQATNITKVPVLSEIPLIGQFFRGREKTRSRTELVIFMTPRIVSSAMEARAMTQRVGSNIVKEIPDLKKQETNLNPKNGDRPIMRPRP